MAPIVVLRRTRKRTTAPEPSLSLSKPLLKALAKKRPTTARGKREGLPPCGLNRMAASAGERVSELAAEMIVATAMVSANCRSEEHTSELQSLMRISYAVFCLKKKTHQDSANRLAKTYTRKNKE